MFRFKLPDDAVFSVWQAMDFEQDVEQLPSGAQTYQAEVKLVIGQYWSNYSGKGIEFEVLCFDLANNKAEAKISEPVEDFRHSTLIIKHIPISVGYVKEEIIINAIVIANEPVEHVRVHYTLVASTSFLFVEMQKAGELSEYEDTYSANIPAQPKEGSVFYFLEAMDAENNTIYLPAADPEKYAFEIVILHKDVDRDHLPDWWEVENFGPDISKYDDIDDPDNDQLNNLNETNFYDYPLPVN